MAVTRDLEDAVGHRLGAHAEVDLHLRLLLLEQDLRRVRLLQRQVLQVHALDLEHGGLVLVGHDGVFRKWQAGPRGAAIALGPKARIIA